MEPLNKSARAICERFFAAARRDFAGIIVFISRNHNKAAAKKIRKAPQTHLFRGSLGCYQGQPPASRASSTSSMADSIWADWARVRGLDRSVLLLITDTASMFTTDW